ncbi:MAG: hypothetical protein MUE33_09370 [Cytophagaceae bacterium]|jgi:hypothetical protein|nr:hypothetical protein [Cytophagaceae bacterium]
MIPTKSFPLLLFVILLFTCNSYWSFAQSNKDVIKKQKQMGKSTGDINVSKPNGGMQGPKNNEATVPVKSNKDNAKKQKQMAKNTGDQTIPSSNVQPPKYDNTVVVNDKPQRKASKQISKYQGDMVPMESQMQGPKNSGSLVLAREINRKQEKDRARYSGDLPSNFLQKRTQQREDKNRQVSSYKGDILVRTLNQRAQRSRKKSKEIANYRGDIIVKKMKKGMHPSAVYQGGKVKNSYSQKEKYRQKMLKKYGKNEDIEKANWQKQKQRAPRYDSREADIWNLKPKPQSTTPTR